MKLLFISESFPTSVKAELTGGVESRDFYTAKVLAKKHQVTVITAGRVQTPKIETFYNFTVKRVGKEVAAEKRESMLARCSFLYQSLATGYHTNFDLVQGSNVFTQAIAFILGSLKRKPKVALIPDIYVGSWIKNTNLVTGIMGECLERLVLKLPWNLVVSWSQATKNKLISVGVSPKIIKVVPGGVDYEFCRNLEATKFKFPTITFAARLVSYKRAIDLLMATTVLIKSFPDLKVNIIGSGPELESLKKKTNELKLSGYIKFWGFVASHNQVLSIIKKSQLFCLPSVVEGFGLVTIEAMACGVPYVNSNIPPTVEVTNNGKGGLLFTPLNPVDLANKCTKILKDKKQYQQKVAEGLKLAKEYSWDKTVGELEKMYIKLTKIRSTKYEIRNKYKL